jgi:hypothetical protein
VPTIPDPALDDGVWPYDRRAIEGELLARHLPPIAEQTIFSVAGRRLGS